MRLVSFHSFSCVWNVIVFWFSIHTILFDTRLLLYSLHSWRILFLYHFLPLHSIIISQDYVLIRLYFYFPAILVELAVHSFETLVNHMHIFIQFTWFEDRDFVLLDTFASTAMVEWSKVHYFLSVFRNTFSLKC